MNMRRPLVMRYLYYILFALFLSGFINVGNIVIYDSNGLARAVRSAPKGYATVKIVTFKAGQGLWLEARQSGVSYFPSSTVGNVFMFERLGAYGSFDIRTSRGKESQVKVVKIQ